MALFDKFKKTWRNKFTSKFADDAEYNESMQVWGEALADLTPEQLKRGLRLSVKSLIWPPEIAEFIDFAVISEGESPKLFRAALPKPVNRELALSSIADIRALL